MTNLCGICGQFHAIKSLKLMSENNLLVEIKLKEIFKIELCVEKLKSKNICDWCLISLETSYTFYKQVTQAQQSFVYDIKEEVVDASDLVTVKIEPKDDENCEDFASFSGPSAYFYPPSRREFRKTKKSKSRRKSVDVFENINSETTPMRRKQSKGKRPYKPKVLYTMHGVFEQELQHQKFLAQPEVMDLSEEDKGIGGLLNPSKSLLSLKLWSNYPWNCNICQEAFENVLEMNHHLQKAHQAKYRTTCAPCHKDTYHYASHLNHIIEEHNQLLKFCCIICSEYRWNFIDLLKHYEESHESSRIFFCLYCGLHFFTGSYLNDHVIRKHRGIDASKFDGPKLECDYCGFQSVLKVQMVQHLYKHRPKETFYCDQCARAFTHPGHLSTHIKENHENAAVVCSECGKTFTSVKKFRVHNRMVHLQIKNHACEICNKAFYLIRQLKEHMLIHDPNAKGKHQCPFCERSFKYHSGFQYHVRMHTGERPYRCPIAGCEDLTFVDSTNTRKHIKGVHNSDAKPKKV